MGGPAIRVEGVGKRYRLHANASSLSLFDTLAMALARLGKR